MRHTLRLDRDTIGPSDPLVATLTDQSMDFQASANWVHFFLKDPQTSPLVAVYRRIRDVTVLGPQKVELRIREVGFRPNQIPPGTYDLIASVPGHWEAWGDRLVRVVVQSQTIPAPTVRQRVGRRLRMLALAFRLLPFTLPLWYRWLLAYWLLVLIPYWIRIGLLRLPLAAPVGDPAPPRRAPPPPPRPSRWLRPLADGSRVMPAVYEEVMKGGDDFIDLATWGLDDKLRMSAAGQHDTRYHADALLRASAARITRRRERRGPGRVPWEDAPHSVRVLVWNASIDDDYEPPGNDLGHAGVTMQRYTGPRGVGRLTNAQLADELRLSGSSGANRRLLGLFHTAYRNLQDPPAELPYPSGVLTLIQNHPDRSIVGSHHQKFVVTESRAYVGGVNFLKEYWDRPEHRASEPDRDTSRGVGSGGSGPAGPLHDTGAILADSAVQARLHRHFSDRWNEAVRHENAFEGLKEALSRAQHHGSWRDRPIYQRLRRDLDRVDATVSRRMRNTAMAPKPIPAHDVDTLDLTLTLPAGSVWRSATETDKRYRTEIEATTGANDTIYIETQYFPDRLRARSIYAAWVASGRPGMGGAFHSDQDLVELPPFAHIVLPYVPSTSPFDVSFLRESEFDAILEGEFKHLRWLELKTMRLIRTLDNDRWERAYTLTAASTIRIADGADADPTRLDDDTDVTVTNVEEYGTRNPVAQVTMEVEEFLPEGDVTVYTVASSDGAGPTGSDGEDRQRQYLEDHGIYIHSKASIFLRNDGGHVATVGSANLNARSLRPEGGDEPDTETNVWWTKDREIEAWYNHLVAEHTLFSIPPHGVHDGGNVRKHAFDQLNRIRTGSRPLGHLVRLDLADRWNHLD